MAARCSTAMMSVEPRARLRPRPAGSGDHARLAPPAAARRAEEPGPGDARRARQDERQPDARPPADHAAGRAVRGADAGRLSRAAARARGRGQWTTRSKTKLPSCEVDRDHVLRAEPAFEDQLRDRVLDLAAGSRASAAARRTPDRSRPWPARPAPRGETSSFMSIFSQARLQHLAAGSWRSPRCSSRRARGRRRSRRCGSGTPAGSAS